MGTLRSEHVAGGRSERVAARWGALALQNGRDAVAVASLLSRGRRRRAAALRLRLRLRLGGRRDAAAGTTAVWNSLALEGRSIATIAAGPSWSGVTALLLLLLLAGLGDNVLPSGVEWPCALLEPVGKVEA